MGSDLVQETMRSFKGRLLLSGSSSVAGAALGAIISQVGTLHVSNVAASMLALWPHSSGRIWTVNDARERLHQSATQAIPHAPPPVSLTS